ncbi:histone H3-like [Neocloeon triangulifer]|uniref:histone H3-like n=1 Tax=Neocloeon triangulifer TaxID=2078957 RepID=UPI00286F55F3|nr:histone H3-like [Neocloeon triangulifer]
MARTKTQVRNSKASPKKSLLAAKQQRHQHPALALAQKSPKKREKPPTSKGKTTAQKKAKERPRPGAKALMEIRKYQKSHELLIPKLSFGRCVREAMNCFSGRDLRITAEALMALQESAEAYMVQFLEDSFLLTLHAKRRTLFAQDIVLLKRLRGRDDPCN